MSSPLPHSSIIAKQIEEFLNGITNKTQAQCVALPTKSEYRAIYKCSLASFCVLSKLAKRELTLVKAAAGLTRRIPVLIATSQLSLAYVQLRQFIELSIWFPYFKEHPVEWAEFLNNPDLGISRDIEFPIKHSAHRELTWYFNYARERFANENSGIPTEEIGNLRTQLPILSPNAHAAFGAVRGDFDESFDRTTIQKLRNIRTAQRIVFSSGVLLMLSTVPHKIDRFDAVERGWLDWLVSARRARKLRSGGFGLR